jgi:adenylate cyclase
MLARRFERRLWLVRFFGALVGGSIGIVGNATGAGTDLDPAHGVRNAAAFGILQAAILVVFTAATYFGTRRLFGPVARWLLAAREATPDERDALAGIPRRMVVAGLIWWAATIPASLVLYYGILGEHYPFSVFIPGFIAGFAAMSATTGLVVYLLADRALRPLTGLASRSSDAPRPSRIGALPRLLMAFGIGVGLPLIAVSLSLVGLPSRQMAAARLSLWSILAAVIVAGFIVAIISARAVTKPIAEIRSRFARLRAGDLDVDVDVNEPGEIGELQAGFNSMVGGLRERERIRAVFGRLVGKEVAQHALDHDSSFDGDVREATAMFVDMIGSTSLAESNTPRDYLTKLNAFFDIVVRHVEAAGGFVNQFHGDGAVCIFGALVVQEDHAVRALRAARTLRGDLDCFAETSGIESVIGLSTGTVIVGQVGTQDRYELAVVGDAVNEAKRLSDEAKATDVKVLVSEATIRAAEGEVGNWAQSGSVHLRGRSGPTTAFALRGPAADDANRAR